MSLALAFALAAAAPRIFSADFCADQIALALVDASAIAALSPDAEKDFSYMRRQAAGVPRARADAERVAASGASLVLRFWGGDAARLEKLGVKVVTLVYASDFEGVKENIRVAAQALGAEEKGVAMIADIDARLDALAAKGPSRATALYVTPGGVTAGAQTMIDTIFSAAGVVNAASAAGLSYWPPLSAETLIADPPGFIVTGFFTANSETANHWSAARHPALKRLIGATPGVHLDTDLISCPGWFSLDAAEKIRAAADAREAAQ